jgi:hypothetical protein
VRWAHDDDRVHGGIGNQFLRSDVRSRDLEFFRDISGKGRVRIRYCGQLRLGKPSRQITCVHAAKTPKPDQPNLQPPSSAHV